MAAGTAGQTSENIQDEAQQLDLLAAGINLSKVNGSAFSNSNPLLTELNIQNWVRSGQAYATTTGNYTSTASTRPGLSIFNPSTSGKSLLIWSLHFYHSATIGDHRLNLTTSDPALGTSPTISNLKGQGQAASVATVSSNTTSNTTMIGTTIDVLESTTSPMGAFEFLEYPILLPAGTANGVVVYLNSTTAVVDAISAKWIEF